MKAVVLGVLVALMPLSINATPIGQLFLGGQAEVTQTTIDWTPFLPGSAYNGTGTTLSTGAGTGIFSGLSLGDNGTIVDRDALAGQPAGSPILVQNWLTFASLPGLALDLTYILPGLYSSADCFAAPADEQTCTPPAGAPFTSPYNLSNFDDGNGLSSNATFSVRGIVRDTNTNLAIGLFEGVFGAEFQNQSYQQVLAQVLAPNGAVLASYSAQITAEAIPEPSTTALFLIGSALVGAGWFRRRPAGRR